jgi:DMSO reductase anchor subunit
MHPAWSIIIFTTLSGLGYGLAAMLGLGLLDPAWATTKVAHFTALALISLGLLSSTLHLGNPQRAWRALSQWRSSWLSREGVMALATYVPLCAAAWLSMFENRHVLWIGLVGALGCAVTVWCTSMIYASLRAVQAWNTPLTTLSYLGFALAGGLLLSAMFAAFAGRLSLLLSLAALIALAGAWFVKLQWRARMERMPLLSTPESATGLGHIGKVRLFEPPHATGNYLTREMGFRVARRHARKLWQIALALGGWIPALLLVLALASGGATAAILMLVAVLLHAAGIWTERWLFFAEARHAVMNYYDERLAA